jgi:hypothetical protein
MLICVCLRILASSRIPRYDLGRQNPSFLRWFCHTYSLAKCIHYRGIGDTRNGIAKVREPLDEGAWGFPRALLDGVEIGLVTRPSISALKVGRELAAQL